MRRGICALLVASALPALLVSGRPVDGARAATSCTKQTKRVVTQVRRHGRRRRVVHRKQVWICQEVAPPAASPATTPPADTATTPAPTPAPPTEVPAPQPEPVANAIGITADDHTHPFTYLPTRTTVRSGALTVQLNNKGEDPHNMDIQRVGPGGEGEGAIVALPTTAPGDQSTKNVELATGTYRMWCTFANHAEEGMETHITVAE